MCIVLSVLLCVCVCAQGLNVSLYWKNPDPRKYVNVVPTSAITGAASAAEFRFQPHLLYLASSWVCVFFGGGDRCVWACWLAWQTQVWLPHLLFVA